MHALSYVTLHNSVYSGRFVLFFKNQLVSHIIASNYGNNTAAGELRKRAGIFSEVFRTIKCF